MRDRDLETISYVTRRFNSLQGLRAGMLVGIGLLCCGIGSAHGYLGLAGLAGWGLMLVLQGPVKSYYADRFGVVIAPPLALPAPAGELAVLGLGDAAPRIRQVGPAPWLAMSIYAAMLGVAWLTIGWGLRLHQGFEPIVRSLYAAAAVVFCATWWKQGERRASQLGYVCAACLCAMCCVRGPAASIGTIGEGGIGGWFVVVGFCWLACGIADHLLLIRVLGRRGIEA